MPKFFNVPLSSDFLQILFLYIQKSHHLQISISDSIVILPNQRAVREFAKQAKKIQNLRLLNTDTILLPFVTSYSRIYENITEFLVADEALEEVENAISPKVMSRIELQFLLHNILKSDVFIKNEFKINCDIQDILRALSEFYHYEYDLELLKNGTEKEKLMYHIIYKVNEYCKTCNKTIEQQRQVITAANLRKVLQRHNRKSVFCVVPVNNVPYINNIIQAIATLDNAHIFFNGFVDNTTYFAKQKTNESIQSCSNQKFYLYHLYCYIKKLNINPSDLQCVNIESMFQQDYKISFVKSGNELIHNLDFHINNILCNAQFFKYWYILKQRHYYINCLDNIEVLAAFNQQEEAKIILSIIESNLASDNNCKLAVITQDRALVERIKANLASKDILYNDSTPSRLTDYRAIQFFILILEVLIDGKADIKIWLSIFKNSASIIFTNHSDVLCEFEKNIIRKTSYLQTIDEYFLSSKNSKIWGKIQPIYEYIQLIAECRTKIIPLMCFQEILQIHFQLYQNLIAEHIRQSYVSVLLAEFICNILSSADFNTVCNNLLDYKELLISLLQNIELRENNVEKSEHVPVEILTPIEARLLKFNLAIVPGMQESMFPIYLKDHGYISKETRSQYHGFNFRELEIGYCAFDFAHLLSQKRVIFTYSKIVQGVNLEPSRFIERLLAYIKLSKKIDPYNSDYHELIKGQYKAIKVLSATRPKLKLFSYMPQSISMSGIERLIRNPYAYYIHDILKMKALDAIPKSSSISIKDFGIVLHDVLALAAQQQFIDKNKFLEIFYKKMREYFPFINFQDHLDMKDYKQVNASGITQFILRYFFKFYIEKVAEWFVVYQNTCKQSIARIYTEVIGHLRFVIENNKMISIIARADRIDIAANLVDDKCAVKIIDYKTGNIPSFTDIKNGKFPQLPIEGLIFLYGDRFSIDCIDDSFLENIYTSYISLNRKLEVLIENETIVPCDFAEVYQNLERLIKMFFSRDSLIFASHQKSQDYKTEKYIHISRHKEWQYNTELI